MSFQEYTKPVIMAGNGDFVKEELLGFLKTKSSDIDERQVTDLFTSSRNCKTTYIYIIFDVPKRNLVSKRNSAHITQKCRFTDGDEFSFRWYINLILLIQNFCS